MPHKNVQIVYLKKNCLTLSFSDVRFPPKPPAPTTKTEN